RCGKGWKGNRCHISAKPLQPQTSSLLKNDIWIGFGIGFLLIKITTAALYFLLKKKVPETKMQETAISSFANPLYLSSSGKAKSPDYATASAVQISVSPWHEYTFNENVNAASFPNPLYGVAAEDMEKLCSSLK
ncbi:MALR1 protein, partial [Hippolais icterina]|nr:MALR1 protein [Hippolais icterina]